MESNNELKEIDIRNCTCCYFHDIMRVVDINLDNILLDEKLHRNSYENILIYDISSKYFMGEKLLCIRFDKGDEFIKIYDGTRYLELLDPGWRDAIYNRARFFICVKSAITDSSNHNFARIRIDSYNSLPTEKISSFHNVIILIKCAINKNENNYYYDYYGSYDDKSYTIFFKNQCLYIINTIL